MSWLGLGMTRLCKTTQATNRNNYLQRLREYQEVEQISTVPPFGLPKINSSVAGSGMPTLFASQNQEGNFLQDWYFWPHRPSEVEWGDPTIWVATTATEQK